MPPIDTPLNKAHQHASNAEDYVNQGLLIPAAEEHYKSAEAFLQCVDQASDEGTKRTLRMLYNEHNKAGKELQRKIAKLKEEGKDPNLPQRPPALPRERTYFSSPSENSSTSSSSKTISRGRLGDSNHTIDESYMVLGQQSDPMDTFNQFWKDLEGMLDNLSQPVAFATAPLARFKTAQSIQGHFQKVTGLDEKVVNARGILRSDKTEFPVGSVSKDDDRAIDTRLLSQRSNISRSSDAPNLTRNTLREAMEGTITSNTVSLSDTSDSEEVLADEDSPSGESFFMIPSATSPSLATKLQKENQSLKVQIASLQQRLDAAERLRIEQEEQLRQRIVHARREAQRVKSSVLLPQRPPPLDINSLNFNVPPLPSYPMYSNGNGDQEVQSARRVKELEEELKSVRIENEKQKAMIAKFRERWEKLKESAKRKRTAKAAGSDNVRDQRIDEEPEAEVAAEVGESSDPSHPSG